MVRRIIVAASILAGLAITLIVAAIPESAFFWLKEIPTKVVFLSGIYLLIVSFIGWSFGYYSKNNDTAIERHEKMILKNNRFCLILASSIIGLNPGIKSIEALTEHGDLSLISTSFGWIEASMVVVMIFASIFFTMYHKSIIPQEQLA